MIKSFKKDGVDYSPVQNVNGGIQWRAKYSDGEHALRVFYNKKATRKIIIDGFYNLQFNEQDDPSVNF